MLKFIIVIAIFGVELATTSSPPIVPVFEPREHNISVNVGETAILRCAVRGLGTRTVLWRRKSDQSPLTIGSFVFTPDNRIALQRVLYKNEWNLVIRNAQTRDSGEYECAVSSRIPSYRQLVILNVSEEPYHMTSGGHIGSRGVVMSGEPFISEGGKILLTCYATIIDGVFDQFDWFVHGIILNHNMPRVSISQYLDNETLYSTLEIQRARMTDGGTYVCRGPAYQIASSRIHIINEK